MPYDKRTGLFRNFSHLASGNNSEELRNLVLHSEIDPISGERTITIYTDDGHGNGDGVLILVDPGIAESF